MMHNWQNFGFHREWGGAFNTPWAGPLFMVGLGIITIWSLVWKGLALWKSSRNESKVWFIVLLLINTAGILDILYIYYFSRKPDNWLHRLARKIHQ